MVSANPYTTTVEADQPPGESNSHADTESRNLASLAMQQIVIRIGWIFKTESVIIPAFVDMIAGPAWIRGFLPILNRIGQSIPQFLFADRLRSIPLKRSPLGWFAVLMGVPWLIMSFLVSMPNAIGSIWLPVVFLALYCFFFSMTGLNQLCLGTITGKLVSPGRRGRLIAIAGVVGVAMASTTAWNVLPYWLAMKGRGFVWLFLFVGSMFVLAGATVLFIREEPDNFEPKKRAAPFGDAWKRVRADTHFTKILIISILFVTSLLLIPHYQALARGGRSDLSGLMVFVVAQNLSAGVMSLLAGMVADRFGFRLSIRVLLLLSGCCPLVAIALATWADPKWFVLAFILFGAIPLTFRSLENYCLELTEPSRHAQYISTLKLFMPITLFVSPLVGLLIDRIGFGPVFITIGMVNLSAMVMTFFIEEPRHWTAKTEQH